MELASRLKLCFFLLVLVFVFTLTGCEKKDFSHGVLERYHYEETEEVGNFVKVVTNKDKVFLIELYPEVAPVTVKNFQKLVADKFYDGLIFHRVIDDFVIQTGDPNGTGFGGSEDKILGEFANNGVKNDLKHAKGIVAMARQSNDPNSASSQFYICVSDQLSSLDGDYATFGKVIAGYDVVEEISKVTTDSNDKPTKVQKIKNIRFVQVNKE